MTGLEFQAIAYVMSLGVKSFTVAKVIVYTAALVATGYGARRLAEIKAKEAEQDMALVKNRAVEIQNMQYGSTGNRRFIYGEMIVNGHLVFQETAGTDNKDLYRMIYLGEGPINSATEVYFDDAQITNLSGDLDGAAGVSSMGERITAMRWSVLA